MCVCVCVHARVCVHICVEKLGVILKVELRDPHCAEGKPSST